MFGDAKDTAYKGFIALELITDNGKTVDGVRCNECYGYVFANKKDYADYVKATKNLGDYYHSNEYGKKVTDIIKSHLGAKSEIKAINDLLKPFNDVIEKIPKTRVTFFLPQSVIFDDKNNVKEIPLKTIQQNFKNLTYPKADTSSSINKRNMNMA